MSTAIISRVFSDLASKVKHDTSIVSVEKSIKSNLMKSSKSSLKFKFETDFTFTSRFWKGG